MDVSAQLKAHAEKYKTVVQDEEFPLNVDAGLLTVYDPSPINEEEYNMNPEAYIASHALPPLQTLLTALFTLPTSRTSSGPLASLPVPTTLLPREKSLPKPKPPTKWERFAAEKGISHRVKDKMEWDEDRQEFVARWGRGGLNKKVEEQWITEVKVGADGKDVDPAVTAKEARKARTSKNLKQQQANIRDADRANPNPRSSSSAASSSSKPISRFAAAAAAAAAGVPISVSEGSREHGAGGRVKEERKKELERRTLLGKVSTGSMGKFDNKLKDEPKVKGMKRKFDPTTIPFTTEKAASLNILSTALGHPTSSKRARAEGHDAEVLNVRKAVRYEGKREAASRGGRGGGRGGSRGGRGGGGRGRGK
ncbi:ribosome biogenesis regulatory protein-domain-containing protein [Mrakia frigida]|uniref:ribosome biogenesis protein RRS1 n=1 Tax=Mrakia frigida TaxID=29902 RepID=UPI003FCBF08D